MVQTTLNSDQIKQAKTPHNIFNLNIILVHLFTVVILFELNLIHWLWIIPIASLSIMLFQYFYGKSLFLNLKENPESHWYVAANWALAIRHNRIIFMAYLICGSIFLTGYIISSSLTTDPNMSNISMMIFLYLSGNLMLLTLVVTFVLSSGALWHTNKGEITRALEKLKTKLLPVEQM
ncbi:hypothetical protein JCM30760_22840 [Thiomicrorhabdus hydrogeniphila]